MQIKFSYILLLGLICTYSDTFYAHKKSLFQEFLEKNQNSSFAEKSVQTEDQLPYLNQRDPKEVGALYKSYDDYFVEKPSYHRILKKFGDILLPIVAIVGLTILQVYVMQKMMEEPAFKVYRPGEIDENFESIAGNHEAKEAFVDIVEYLKNPEKYVTVGAKPTTGILLTGVPGTGKTLLARALAGEANCSFIYASGAEFNAKYVGSGVQRVKQLFNQARSQCTWAGTKIPCIIFIDEIEVLAKQRGTGDNYGDQSVNELLAQLDGFVKTQGHPVIVIAATNYPEKIDSAITRPGRIDRIIHISTPDLDDREGILRVHLKKMNHEQTGIDLHSIAQRTVGFTGAELAGIVNSAARIAVNRNALCVAHCDLEEALDLYTIGIASKKRLSTKEVSLIAYHEAGHALINMLVIPERVVNKITIIPRGETLGVTHFMFTEDTVRYTTKDDCLNMIAVLLGGRAAEELVCKVVSTTTASDLQEATKLARSMISYHGMGDNLSVQTTQHALSENAVQEQIDIILKQQYQRVQDLLNENMNALHKLAQALIEKDTLLATDIAALNLVLQC